METVKKIDTVVIGLSALILISMFGYARPLIISPVDGLETTNSSVLFSFSKANTILIDDNIDFTSPITVHAKDNLVVSLAPGSYYWKISGLGESKVNTLTVQSQIDLRLKENGENYELVNAGNVQLSVQVYNGSVIQGNIILDVDESENATGTLFVGREKDE